MVLVPLCGSGTRGDQVDNAEFFKARGAAEVLLGAEADSEHLKTSLTRMLDKNYRAECITAIEKLTQREVPARKIAQILYDKINTNQ